MRQIFEIDFEINSGEFIIHTGQNSSRRFVLLNEEEFYLLLLSGVFQSLHRSDYE